MEKQVARVWTFHGTSYDVRTPSPAGNFYVNTWDFIQLSEIDTSSSIAQIYGSLALHTNTGQQPHLSDSYVNNSFARLYDNTSTACGHGDFIDPDDFTRALVLCLKEDEVLDVLLQKMGEVVKGEVIPLYATFDNLRREMASGAAVADLKTTVNALREEIWEKDAKILTLEEKVAEMESTTDDLEQYTHRNSLRLVGVPETEEDTTEVTLNVLNESLLLSPPLTSQELDRLHCVRPRDEQDPRKPRPILIKFATYRARHCRRKGLYTREEYAPKLFLNEDLTKRLAQLLAKTRALKKNKKLSGAWTPDGKILIKTNQGKVQPVRSAADLRPFADETRTPPPSFVPPGNHADAATAQDPGSEDST
ncbi:hypothetical protein CAPTEDRAFT_192352 [Capitella teleta]|uniref:Uncharacterized protein n=1 Tax=Capitella teleta TaxID=283909 RepID=R7T6T7_CAPTE|nr:hypothetical protein CAPTEDRAFT_192352 [Capitella teleta]|eukprot:ELT89225.1 hypothetical protein CAPTEDRAFT_192352 [Capitella teleta]